MRLALNMKVLSLGLALAAFGLAMPVPATAAPIDFRLKTGTYLGDGSPTRPFTTLGFQPEVVIIKSVNATPAVIRTATMSGNVSKELGVNTPFATDRIRSLDADGFTIGSDVSVNGMNVQYHWVAMDAAAGAMAVGQYTGNGQDDRNIGLGFKPDFLMLLPEASEHAMHRFAGQLLDESFEFTNSGAKSNRIQTFTATGFQVGNHNTSNKSSVVYHFVAFDSSAGVTAVGAYPGTNPPPTLSVTKAGFQPDFVLLKRYGSSPAVYRPNSESGDKSLPVDDTAELSGAILSLDPFGFTVGALDDVNKEGDTYHYVVMRNQGFTTVSGVRLFDGNALPATSIVPLDTMFVETVVTHSMGFKAISAIEFELFLAGNYQASGSPAVNAKFNWQRGGAPSWKLIDPTNTTWSVVPELCVLDSMTNATTPQTVRLAFVASRIARSSSSGQWRIEVRVHTLSPPTMTTTRVLGLNADERLDLQLIDATGEFAPGPAGTDSLPIASPPDGHVEVQLIANTGYRFDARVTDMIGRTTGTDTLYTWNRIRWSIPGMGSGTVDTSSAALLSGQPAFTKDEPLALPLYLWIDHPPGQPTQQYDGLLPLALHPSVGGGDSAAAQAGLIADVRTSGLAASSALGEVTPDTVVVGTPGQTFRAYLMPDIQGGDTGIDRVMVNIPAGYGAPSVSSVWVSGLPVVFADFSTAGLVDIRLGLSVSLNQRIEVRFDADVPTVDDSTGADFSMFFDDTGTTTPPQAAIQGDANGASGDDDTWRVIRVTAPATAIDALPDDALVFTDSTAQFSAVVTDAFGNALSDPVTWNVSGGIGTVDASGFFTATTPGAGGVIAQAGTLRDTSAVGVETTPAVVVESVSGPGSVTRGQAAFGLAMHVRNPGTEPLLVDSLHLTFTRVATGDADADFSLGPSDSNPDTIPAGSSILLAFDTSVTGSAATGPVSIDGFVVATAVGSGVSASDTGADTIWVLNVQSAPNLSVISSTLSPASVQQGQSGITFSIDVANAGQAGVATGAGSTLKIYSAADSIVIPYSGTAPPAGPQVPEGIGPTWTFGLASIPAGFPVGPHEARLELSGVDDNGKPFQAGSLVADSVSITPAPPPVMVTLGAAQASQTILPGGKELSLMSLAIVHDDGTPLTLQSLTLDNAAVGPGTPAELDGDFGTLSLWLDDGDGKINPLTDTELGQAAMASGRAVFNPLSLAIPVGAIARLVVGAKASLQARDGDSLDVRITDGTRVTFDRALAWGNSWPLDPPGGLLVNGMTAAQVVEASPPDTAVIIGAQRVLAMDLTIPPNGYQSDVLDSLRLVNLGDALPSQDITAVEVWRDGGDGSFDAGAVDDALLGNAPRQGTRWALPGVSAAVPPAGLRLFASVNISSMAVDGRQIQLAVPSTVPRGFDMASGNDGPIDTLVSASRTITIQDTTASITVTQATQAPAVLVPGAPARTVFRLGLMNNAARAETLTTLTFANRAAGPGTQAQLDASWTPLELMSALKGSFELGAAAEQTNAAPPPTATFTSGRATFSGLSIVIPGGKEVILTVNGGASVTARDSDVLDLEVENASSMTFTPVVPVNAVWPLSPAAAFTADGMGSGQIVISPIPSSNFFTGTARNLVLNAVLPANGYQTDQLNRLNVVNAGSAVSGADIERVEAWVDTGDDLFDPAVDTRLGIMSFTGDRWELTALARNVPLTGLRIYVTCDIADLANEGRTLRFELPTLPDVGVGMASANDGPVDAPAGNPSAQTVSSADRVTLSANPIAPGAASPGVSGLRLVHIVATNSYAVPKTLTAVTFTNTTSGPGTPSQRDSEVSSLSLREDGNDDGVLQDTGTDPLIGSGFFSSGRVTFTGLSWTLAPGESRHLFVTMTTALNTARDGDVVSAQLSAATDVAFSDETAVAASLPLDSGARWTIDGMVANQIVPFGAPSATVGPSEGPVLALDVALPRNGYADDVLRGVVLRNLGSASSSDIAEIRLWRDGGNGQFDTGAGDDVNLGAMTPSGSDWTSPFLSEVLPAAKARLYASVTASAAPTDSATVQLSIPVGGLTVDSGNDGPIDAAVENDEQLVLSTAALLTELSIVPAASTLGQSVSVTMAVRNAGSDTISSIAPSALAASGSGSLGYVSGPTPATLTLAPGDESVFVWSMQADSTGDVRLSGNATGIENGSGLSRQSLGTISNRHQIFLEAQNVDLFSVESMPFSINRGQEGVVPISLTFDHPGAEGGSDIRVLALRVRLEDEFGTGIVPAALLSRVVVNEGADVFLDKTTLETSGSVVDLTLAQPVIVEAGSGANSQVTLSLTLDISDTTSVPNFRLSIVDSTWFTVNDATSGAPVAVRRQGGTYPIRSGLARIGAEATELDVDVVASANATVARGQTAVPLATLTLLNPDPSGLAADVRTSGLHIDFVDSTGVRVPDPERYLARIRVRSSLQTHLDRAVSALDDTTLALSLSPLVNAPANTPINLMIEADLAPLADLGTFRLQLSDTASFDARDANTGVPVAVLLATAPAPLQGHMLTLVAPAETVLVARESGIAPGVTIGQTGVSAVRLRLTHPGAPQTSRIRVDDVTLYCRDQLDNPLIPATYVDRMSVEVGGATVGALTSIPSSGSSLTVPLSGVMLDPGNTLSLLVRFDVEPTAPVSFLAFDIESDGIGAVDDNLGQPVTAAPGTSFPLTSGLTQLEAPARELVVAWSSLMPAALASDGGTVVVGRMTLRNTAPPASGSILVSHLGLRAADRDLAPMPIGPAVESVEAWIADTLWAQSGSLSPADAQALLAATDTLEVVPGQPVTIELRAAMRAGGTVQSLRLGGDASEIGVVQPASALLSVSVLPDQGQSFPFWTAAGNFGGASLSHSYSNFPNPFAAGREPTTFVFYLESAAQVTLTLWTGRGDRVRTLIDGTALPAGLHQNVAWDGMNGTGRTVTNGVYVAEIIVQYAGGNRERLLRKVAVVR